MSVEYVVVLTTTETNEQAEKLALKITESFLAACVTVLAGATSYYHWQGKLEKAQECQLIIKTQTDLLDKLVDLIKSNHPYTEPEIIAMPIIGGSESYLKWLNQTTSQATSKTVQ